jgi:glycosyltransferase involved in cell wall biosynthesis
VEVYVKLCFLIYYWPRCGGVETVTRILAKEFSNRGNNVYIAYFHNSGVDLNLNYPQIELPDKDNFDSIENINLLNNFLNTNKIDIIICKFWTFVSLADASRKETSAKLIYCHHNSLIMPLAARKFKIFNNLFNFLRNKKYIFKWISEINKIYKCADAFVLLSNAFAKQYKKIFWYRNCKKIHVIINPLQYDLKEQIDFDKKEKYLLFLGRVEENQKRISLIIEFWRTIYNKYPDWTLLIAGGGPDLEKVKKSVENLPRVRVEGFVDSAQEYYCKSSIFLMTSAFEGLPMTLVEAQNFGGVPVAMDSFVSIGDIIDDGQNGFIVPNNDLNAFTEKICILMDNAELREKMAKNGMESVKKYSMENIIGKWEELFKKLGNKG